jgi:hypothetical protein
MKNLKKSLKKPVEIVGKLFGLFIGDGFTNPADQVLREQLSKRPYGYLIDVK